MSVIDLYNDDCKNTLQLLNSKNTKIDCIIADIPYNIKQASWDSEFNLEEILPMLHNLLKDV